MDRRQKRLEKKRKKRALAKKRQRAVAAKRPDISPYVIKAAARSPFGPCVLSAGWDETEEPIPLVTAVISRRLPDGGLVAEILLIDRTCLGVKNAFVEGPLTEERLEDLIDSVGGPHGGMDDVEPLVAQSVVYHALDYAGRLGFRPQRDFVEALVGPRPAELSATPFHARERPLYASGPRDNVGAIVARLEEAVGEGGFDFVDVEETLSLDDVDDEDLEIEEVDGRLLLDAPAAEESEPEEPDRSDPSSP